MIWRASWPRYELPPGVSLPDGRVLTYAAHRECPCRDCVDAWAAWRAGLVDPIESEDDALAVM